MDKIKPRTLSGFMELLPAPQQQKALPENPNLIAIE